MPCPLPSCFRVILPGIHLGSTAYLPLSLCLFPHVWQVGDSDASHRVVRVQWGNECKTFATAWHVCWSTALFHKVRLLFERLGYSCWRPASEVIPIRSLPLRSCRWSRASCFPETFAQKGAPASFKLGYSLQPKLTNYVIWFVPSPKFWIILVSVGKCWGKGKRSDNHSLWFLKSIPHEYSRPSLVPVTAERGWPNICSLKYSLFFSRQFYVKYLHCKKENESEILGRDRWSHCVLW